MSKKTRSAARAGNLLEGLERRQLMTFAAADTTFGNGGRQNFAPTDFAGDTAATMEARLTPLADGRIVATNGTEARYLHGDGSLDRKRGASGVRTLWNSWSVVEVAVDPATGRVAVLRPGGIAPVGGFVIDLYNERGSKVAMRELVPATAGSGAPFELGDRAVTLAFGPDSSVYVVSDRFVLDGPTSGGDDPNGDHFAVVQRFNAKTLERDDTYGNGDGSAVGRYADNVYGSESDSASITGLFVDASGRAYVTSIFDNETISRYGATVTESVIRLLAEDQVDTSYGTAGKAALLGYDADSDDAGSIVKNRAMRMSLDGTLFALTSIHYSSDYGPNRATVELRRLSADGKKIDTVDAGGGERVDGVVGQPMSVALAADGSAYVAMGRNETRHFIKSGTTIISDPKWSQFGNVAFTTTDQPAADAVIDRDGRLLITGHAPTWFSPGRISTLAIKGVTETVAPEVPTKSVKLLADGTLIINGGSKADVINIRAKAGLTTVTVNGKSWKFDSELVRGAIIRAGNGDDKITGPGSSRESFVEAGAGNDTVTNTPGILVGGSGNDRLEGGSVYDAIYGQDGNDTLVGGYDTDELFGGNGNDTIYSGMLTVGDYLRDYISGGRGVDTIYYDNQAVYDGDTVVDDADGKRIKY